MVNSTDHFTPQSPLIPLVRLMDKAEFLSRKIFCSLREAQILF
jgi:hypothetical protein